MLAFLITAAEPSKTPFYLVGGVFAIYAVVLAGVGLTRPSFPGGVGGQRIVMAVSFVLLVATIAAAVLTDK